MPKFCPRCMNIIRKKDEKCSKCGMLVSEMEEVSDDKKFEKEIDILDQNISAVDQLNQQVAEEVQEDAQSNAASAPKRHKHKKKQKDLPQYTVDEDGEFNIDTRDVTFLDTSAYSTKKQKGEFTPEKIEWWEIYKWADRYLARRKVMKEVNKASRVRPSFIKKSTMMLLCLFFGWMGAHDYYARNYKKAVFVNASIIISMVFISVPALASVATFIGGGFGFVALYTWLTDLIALMFDKYKYRLSKEAFIMKLNIETRYKISKKYLSLDKIKAEQQQIKDKFTAKKEKKEAKRRAKQK